MYKQLSDAFKILSHQINRVQTIQPTDLEEKLEAVVNDRRTFSNSILIGANDIRINYHPNWLSDVYLTVDNLVIERSNKADGVRVYSPHSPNKIDIRMPVHSPDFDERLRITVDHNVKDLITTIEMFRYHNKVTRFTNLNDSRLAITLPPVSELYFVENRGTLFSDGTN